MHLTHHGGLLAYGELEWCLCNCLSSVLDDEKVTDRNDRAGRILYRPRGEEYRIVVADAIMRSKYKAAGLEPPYSEFIADLGHCRVIRNQYAHSHLWENADSLCIFAFEEGAKKSDDNFTMVPRPISYDLLIAQERFFLFVWAGLMLLSRHYEFSAGRLSSPPTKFPKKMDRPPLHSPKA